MKRVALLPFFLLLSTFASARTIPLAKGGVIPIPDQAVVSPDGITFVRPGDANAFTLKWQDIDLKRLAKQEVEIETSRQKALLTGEKTILGPEAPKTNPYAEFLAVPIKVTFRPKETHQSRVDYNSVTNALPGIDPNTGLPFQPNNLPVDRNGNRIISVAPVIITNGVVTSGPAAVPVLPPQTITSSSTTRSDTIINTTRPALDTTASAFLELISDDTRGATGSLIRELREHPDVFTTLIAALRDLQAQTPNDPSPGKAIQAVQLISRNGSVSVDAQRQLARFVQLAQARAELR